MAPRHFVFRRSHPPSPPAEEEEVAKKPKAKTQVQIDLETATLSDVVVLEPTLDSTGKLVPPEPSVLVDRTKDPARRRYCKISTIAGYPPKKILAEWLRSFYSNRLKLGSGGKKHKMLDAIYEAKLKHDQYMQRQRQRENSSISPLTTATAVGSDAVQGQETIASNGDEGIPPMPPLVGAAGAAAGVPSRNTALVNRFRLINVVMSDHFKERYATARQKLTRLAMDAGKKSMDDNLYTEILEHYLDFDKEEYGHLGYMDERYKDDDTVRQGAYPNCLDL